MSIDRPSRRTLVGVGIVALWVLAVSPRRSPLVLFNRTPSLPTGFYLRWGGDWPRRGDVVALALPPAAWSYARLRGERTDVLLLKHVLAGAGDFVSTLHGELLVNGVRVGSIASVDSAGRPLPHWSVARVLAGDELLVGSSHPRSFDSRYFGPIHANQVLGVYRRLSLGSPSAVPIASESIRSSLASSHPPTIACDTSGGSLDGEHSGGKGEEDESGRAR